MPRIEPIRELTSEEVAALQDWHDNKHTEQARTTMFHIEMWMIEAEFSQASVPEDWFTKQAPGLLTDEMTIQVCTVPVSLLRRLVNQLSPCP